ncbi:hypothetical protein [Phyllobacterium salinisoli]|uniref:hypothetical protein n=1 Tax=Phyllobacterium salinisoli TaxID=1899321 RepID=UPI0011C047B1|nr:hypothetical protein [Phyllobacterium salinisoli]
MRDAVSALARAEREASEEIREAFCYKCLPDNVLGGLTGYKMPDPTLDDFSASEEFIQPIPPKRKSFSLFRRRIHKFPTSL